MAGGEPNKFNSFDEVIVNFYPSLFFLAFLVRPEVARVVCWGDLCPQVLCLVLSYPNFKPDCRLNFIWKVVSICYQFSSDSLPILVVFVPNHYQFSYFHLSGLLDLLRAIIHVVIQMHYHFATNFCPSGHSYSLFILVHLIVLICYQRHASCQIRYQSLTLD